MENNILRYTLRIEASLLDKIHYIANSEGRSTNKEIEQMIKRRIASFEKTNGEITEALVRK